MNGPLETSQSNWQMLCGMVVMLASIAWMRALVLVRAFGWWLADSATEALVRQLQRAEARWK